MIDVPTYSGALLNLAAPDWRCIHLRDIAIQLSRINRWNGATIGATRDQLWSWGQHALHLEELVAARSDRSPAASAYALLSCAPVAYLGDYQSVATLMKRRFGAPFHAALVAPIERAILQSAGLPDADAPTKAMLRECSDRAYSYELDYLLARPANVPPIADDSRSAAPSYDVRCIGPEDIAELYFRHVQVAIAQARSVLVQAG